MHPKAMQHRRNLAVLVLLALHLTAPTSSVAALIVYEVVDLSRGNEYVASFADFEGVHPAAVGVVFDYQFGAGHLAAQAVDGGRGIQWQLDISNLGVRQYIFDSSAPPTTPVPLDILRLAQLGGFDHFNFVQYVTGMPDDVTASIGGFEIPTPFLDPVLDSANNQLDLFSERAQRTIHIAVPEPTDNNIGYYNDALDGSRAEYTNFLTPQTFTFYDHPRIRDDFFLPPQDNDYFTFSTQLIGVYANGSTDSNSFWEGVATNMAWRTNVKYDARNSESGSIFLANPFPEDVPPSVGGQIEILSAHGSAVPEPSSLVAFATFALVALACKRWL